MKVTHKDYDKQEEETPIEGNIESMYEPSLKEKVVAYNGVMELLSPKKGDMILDVGTGVGTFVFRSSKEGADCVGVDYSGISLLKARQLMQRYETDRYGNYDFMRCDARFLPFKDSSFDKIVDCDFLEHVYNEEKNEVIKEMYRVLGNGGEVVTYTPNLIRLCVDFVIEKILHTLKGKRYGWQHGKTGEDHQDTYKHVGLIDVFRIKKLFKTHNFNIVKIVYFNYNFPFLSRLTSVALLPSIFGAQICIVCEK